MLAADEQFATALRIVFPIEFGHTLCWRVLRLMAMPMASEEVLMACIEAEITLLQSLESVLQRSAEAHQPEVQTKHWAAKGGGKGKGVGASAAVADTVRRVRLLYDSAVQRQGEASTDLLLQYANFEKEVRGNAQPLCCCFSCALPTV